MPYYIYWSLLDALERYVGDYIYRSFFVDKILRANRLLLTTSIKGNWYKIPVSLYNAAFRHSFFFWLYLRWIYEIRHERVWGCCVTTSSIGLSFLLVPDYSCLYAVGRICFFRFVSSYPGHLISPPPENLPISNPRLLTLEISLNSRCFFSQSNLSALRTSKVFFFSFCLSHTHAWSLFFPRRLFLLVQYF